MWILGLGGFSLMPHTLPSSRSSTFRTSENQAVHVFISAVEQQMSWNQMDGKHL